MRRNAIEAVGGFDPRYLYFDTFLWLKLLIHYDCAVVTAPLTINRIHAAPVTVQARALFRELTDFRSYLPAYVKRHGRALGITAKVRLRRGLIPAVLVGCEVAGKLNAKRNSRTFHTFAKVPLRYCGRYFRYRWCARSASNGRG